MVEEEVVEVLNSQTGSPVSGAHQRNALNFSLSPQNSGISIPILFYLLLEAPAAVLGCVSLCGVFHFLVALLVL